jgi:hypothetical protein
MDIRCPICGEPWDMDCIHERVEELHPNKPWPHGKDYRQEAYDVYYKPVLHDFRKRGCEALGSSHGFIENRDESAAQLSAMLFDIFGDDVDGIATELDEAEYFGII